MNVLSINVVKAKFLSSTDNSAGKDRIFWSKDGQIGCVHVLLLTILLILCTPE